MFNHVPDKWTLDLGQHWLSFRSKDECSSLWSASHRLLFVSCLSPAVSVSFSHHRRLSQLTKQFQLPKLTQSLIIDVADQKLLKGIVFAMFLFLIIYVWMREQSDYSEVYELQNQNSYQQQAVSQRRETNKRKGAGRKAETGSNHKPAEEISRQVC